MHQPSASPPAAAPAPKGEQAATRGRRRGAFTLIELIVVVIIIAILVAIAGVAYNKFVSDSRDTALMASAKQVATAVQAHSLRNDLPYRPENYTVPVIESIMDGSAGGQVAAGAQIGGGVTVSAMVASTRNPDDSLLHVTMGSRGTWIHFSLDEIGTAAVIDEESTPAEDGAPTEDPTEDPTPDPTPTPTPTEEPVVAPVNTTCATATRIAQPVDKGTTNLSTTSKGATEVWYKLYAPQSYLATSVYLTGPTTGTRTLDVYMGDYNDSNCPSPLPAATASATGTTPGASFLMPNGNRSWFIKVSGDPADFTLSVFNQGSPSRGDGYNNVEGLNPTEGGSPVLSSEDYNTLAATREAGEDSAGNGTVWFSVQNYYQAPGKTTQYTVELLAPNAGKAVGNYEIEVFSGRTSAANPGTVIKSATGSGLGTAISFNLPQGPQYMIRVKSKIGPEAGAFRVRVSRTDS